MLATSVILALPACAQKSSDNGNYNIQRAMEALRDDNDEEAALGFLKAQLDSTPDNPNALLLKGRIEYGREEYGAALKDIAHGEKYNSYKKTGIYQSTFTWWRYRIYNALGRQRDALSAMEMTYSQARREKRDAEDIQSIRFDLASAYYRLDRYSDAEKVYNDMLKADEADEEAMVGLARNRIATEDYAEAVRLLEEAVGLDSDYSATYKFLTRAYDAMGEQKKAVDAALDYARKDDDYPFEEVAKILAKKPVYAEAQLKSRMSSDDWFGYRFLMAEFCDATRNYLGVVDTYTSIMDEYGEEARLLEERGDAFSKLGFMELAMADYTREVEMDGDNVAAIASMAYGERNLGHYDKSAELYSKAAAKRPDVGYLWYAKGWSEEYAGDEDAAFEDFKQGCEVDEDYLYTFLKRAEQYLKRGETEKAREDLEFLVQRDTVLSEANTIYYALHLLGRDDEALDWMDRIIANDPDDSGNWYDRACLLSLMGRRDEAVEAFGTAIDKGFRRYVHARDDHDLIPLHEMPSFQAQLERMRSLIESGLKEYRKTHPAKKAAAADSGEGVTSEVQMRKQYGGTYEVPCSINGLALNMVFDTGASDVTISKVEADFMLKNDYLSGSDVKGKRYYQVADGGLSEGTVVTLKEVRIGDAVLHNVDASVVRSQKAPLLLGESVLQKFGTFTVDNVNSKLIIKQ